MKLKTLLTGAAAAALGAMIAAPASALPLSLFEGGGSTVFEDDSGEFVLRSDGAGGFDVVAGPVEVGDIFGGVIDISSIGGTSLDTLDTEVTGVFLTEVSEISGAGTSSVQTTAGLESFDDANFTFGAVDPTLFAALFGMTAPDAGTVTMLFEDTDNDFSFFADDVTDQAGSVATAIDGDPFLQAILDTGNGDFFFSQDVPSDTTTFAGAGITGDPIDGVTELGSFGFNLTISQYFGPGTLLSDAISGSGSLLFPTSENGGNVFPVQDDVQFSIQVPVPATLGLFGLGLIGLGIAGRRRKRA